MFKKIVEYFTNLWYSIFRVKLAKGGKNVSVINELEKIANDILLENDMMKLPVNLSQIAKNNNIDVFVSHLPNNISGAIRYNVDREKFEILIEEKESNVRQRFTLAHELSHYFLDRNIIENSGKIHFDTLYRKEQNTKEREVEYLAGAILMNKDILTRLYKINPSVEDLARVFNVSVSAMTVRLSILKLR